MTTDTGATITIPLDIPGIRIISTQTKSEGRIFIEVESLDEQVKCGVCGQEIMCNYGVGELKEIRHLPILGRETIVCIRPKRGQCFNCPTHPRTTQLLEWYEAKSPHTKAYDRYLMKLLIGSTIEEVSLKEQVGYDAILGALKREVSTEVKWEEIEEIGTIGIDEIALKKGKRHYAAVITARQKGGKIQILGILEERKKKG